MKTKIASLFAIAMLLAIVMGFTARSQTPYYADRPGMSYTPYLVGLNQIDYAISVGHQYYAPSDCQMHDLYYLTNQFRYGVFKHLELRAGVDVGTYQKANTIYAGVRALNVGVKIPIISGVKNAPDIGIMAQTLLPDIGQTKFTLLNYVPSFSLLLEKSFGKFYIIGNAGVVWDAVTGDGCYYLYPTSNDTYAQGSYSLSAGYFITDKVGVFAETYGYYNSHAAPFSSCDFGLFVAVTPELQWDLSGGFNYYLGFDYSYVNTGIAWRIPNKNK